MTQDLTINQVTFQCCSVLTNVCLAEMSETLPTRSRLCGPDEVNIGGTCKSKAPAVVFMPHARLLLLGQTPKQSGGRGVAMWSGMHHRPLSLLLLMS